VQVAGVTGDSLRDLDEQERRRAGARLPDTGAEDEALQVLEQPVVGSAVDANRVFGEPLPSGCVSPSAGRTISVSGMRETVARKIRDT
jgi:hypothetical protein